MHSYIRVKMYYISKLEKKLKINSEIKPRVVLCQVTLHGLFALRSIASKTAGALSEPEGPTLAVHLYVTIWKLLYNYLCRNESLF